MAVTTIALNDPVSALVNKTNIISNNLGDLATLTTPVTTNLIAAINSVNAITNNQLNDSAEISAAVRYNLQNTGNVTLGATTAMTNITADSAVITDISGVTSTYQTAQGNLADYTTGTFGTANITTFNIDSLSLTQAKPFTIKNSAGGNVLAGYLLSTSGTLGTL